MKILLVCILFSLLSCNENDNKDVVYNRNDTSKTKVLKDTLKNISKTDKEVVKPEILEGLFPETYKSFKLSKATSGVFSNGSNSYSSSERYFKKGKSLVIMRITDYLYKRNVPEIEFLRKVPQVMNRRGELIKTEDYFGNISWNDSTNSGEANVLVYDRFAIKLEVRNVVNFDIEVINFLNKFDIKSLKNLKNN